MKHSLYNIIRRGLLFAVLPLMGGVGEVLISCNSDKMDDEAMYTFTGNTVASFCETTPELSDFYQMIDDCGATTLLSIYGHFTCFAPTNDAIARYCTEKGTDLAHLSAEQKRKIVYSATIRNDNREFLSTDFSEGSLPTPSLSDRYIVISFAVNDQSQRIIRINKQADVVSADNKVHNGVVHVVNSVIEPSEDTFLDRLSQLPDYSIWAAAYRATGMAAGMNDLYDPNFKGEVGSEHERCKMGWTLFAEPDALLKESGLTLSADTLASVEAFAAKWYGTAAKGDYTNKENALHKFIAYHILNRQMSTSSFVYNGFTVSTSYKNKSYEYYETELENRLIEFKAGQQLNTQRNGAYVGLDDSRSNIDVINGFIHTLKNLLVYDEHIMTTDVLHKRIRFDFYAIPPQLTNNNIRWQLETSSGTSVPADFCGKYFWYNNGSNLTMWASNGWSNYQADEMLIGGAMYDFKLRMLPVPPGNYEIRLGYRSEDWRGIAQLFIDGQIAGIPVDLTIGCRGAQNDPRIGYVHDADTKDNGIENDKMMRNHGYMKAPTSIYTGQEGGKTLRDMSMCLRIIIGQYSFSEYGPHEFRAKNMDDKGGGRVFHADYLEYIPIDMIRDEDRE